MGILTTIREHAAVARGNFATIFKEMVIPPLPAVVSQLLTEIHRPEPDIVRVAKIISADPEIAARVMRTVNSSLFNLSHQVLSISHAISMLGLVRIRSLLVSHAMREALPKPKGDLFDHEAYWTDALLRALLARSLTRRILSNEEEEAFTAALLQDGQGCGLVFRIRPGKEVRGPGGQASQEPGQGREGRCPGPR